MAKEWDCALLYWAAWVAAFFALLELASSRTGGLQELSAAALAVCLIWILWRKRRTLWPSVARFPAPARWFVLALAAYLLWDVAGLLYAPHLPYALPKYPPLMLGGGLWVAVVCSALLCPYKAQAFTGVLWAAGVAAAAWAVAGCLWPQVFPMPYTLRLTLRRDYNMFASVVLAGGCCGLWRLTRETVLWRQLRDGAGLCLCATTVLLSGSRRTLLLGVVSLAILLPLRLWRAGMRRALPQLGSWIAIALLVWGGGYALSVHMQGVYEAQGELGFGGGETSLADRYDTLDDASLLEKRLLIWRAGAGALGDYTPMEWLVGRGNAYDILLYDHLDDPALIASYQGQDVTGAMSAHNFLLADLLGGGAIKLLLGAAMSLLLFWCWCSAARAEPLYGGLLAVLLGGVYANNLISNRYGLLYDRLFWLVAALTVAALLTPARKELL